MTGIKNISRMAFAIFSMMALVSQASAADFSKVLVDADGKTICFVPADDDKPCPAGKEATLGRVVRAALYGSFQDEQPPPSTDDKVHRGDLAQAITGAGEIKVKAEDIALMKKLVGKAYGPLVVWAALRELDPIK